mmetsp:Transcript_27447/g.56251  ORF Transcript_27447/g.56251 Transcript_27447/m.56251 type:complete len:120 (+) Transcript_27447:1585-1944(+)
MGLLLAWLRGFWQAFLRAGLLDRKLGFAVPFFLHLDLLAFNFGADAFFRFAPLYAARTWALFVALHFASAAAKASGCYVHVDAVFMSLDAVGARLAKVTLNAMLPAPVTRPASGKTQSI